jgi:hypothetical protein
MGCEIARSRRSRDKRKENGFTLYSFLFTQPRAEFDSSRAGINPAPTVLFVGDGFIPSLL